MVTQAYQRRRDIAPTPRGGLSRSQQPRYRLEFGALVGLPTSLRVHAQLLSPRTIGNIARRELNMEFKGAGVPFRTGALRTSVRVMVSNQGLVRLAMNFYGFFQDKGFYHVRAQRVVDVHKGWVQELIQRARRRIVAAVRNELRRRGLS